MDQLERKILTTKRLLEYTYYTSSAKDKNEVPLLFCHGFPDSSFLWNDVLVHLGKLGVTSKRKVIVPDMLGYGGTSKPLDSKMYSYQKMANDLCDILDEEKVQKAVVVGHDWGSPMVQRFYGFHPDRVDKMILLNVAYHPPIKPGDPPFDLEASNKMFEAVFGAPLWAYWEFFLSEDGPRLMRENLQKVYEAQHGDVEDWSFKLFCVRGAWRKYITGSETVALKPFAEEKRWKDSFFEQFQRDGFEAPIQWYKVYVDGVQCEADKAIPLERHKIEVPVLFIACTKDGNNKVEFIEISRQGGLLPDLTVKQLECGHWSPMERPEEVAGFISEFLA